jgi:hypothetical protein
MAEVTGIDDENLRDNVGRRVQIEGTFENVAAGQPRADTKASADDLVTIRGTLIRRVSGDCPTKP